MRYDSASTPLAIAHRGGAGLAVENTFGAFTRSHALGVRYFETDVRLTADGIPVLFHDAGLTRLVGAPGRLERCRLDALPSWVPTLEAALLRYPDTCFTIDIKVEAAVSAVADVIRRVGAAPRVCVAGAWDGTLVRLADEIGPDLSVAMGWRALCRLKLSSHGRLRVVRAGRATFAHIPVRMGRLPVFVDALLDRAHDVGVRVIVWTVNDAATMTRLLDVGVDGMITDRPDLLREVLIARGLWHPPVHEAPTQIAMARDARLAES